MLLCFIFKEQIHNNATREKVLAFCEKNQKFLKIFPFPLYLFPRRFPDFPPAAPIIPMISDPSIYLNS